MTNQNPIDPHLPRTEYENQMMRVMVKRVGLPLSVGIAIIKMERFCAKRENRRASMVQVACAIKYASDNRHLLKRNYQ